MGSLRTGMLAVLLAVPAAVSAQSDQSDRVDESTMHRQNDGSDRVDESSMHRQNQVGQPQSAKSSAEKNQDDLSPEEARLVVQLHHVNQMEIEVGKLASTKGQHPKVRQYGNRLVRDHTQDDQRVTAFAKQRELSLDSAAQAQNAEQRASMQKHQALMEKLDGLSGAEFDREFLNAMATGHEQVITQVRDARTQVQDPQLRALIDRLLPQLEQHRNTAKRLLESAG
jgi:putative membrane protein